MDGEGQIVSVDGIAHDNDALEKKAHELTRVDVTLDTTETIGKDIEIVDASFPAVLVRRDSAGGAVYVSGPGTPKEEPRVRTGPDQPRGAVILVIKPGQTCVVLGQPSVRYFRPRSSS